jgi:adenylate cyclase
MPTLDPRLADPRHRLQIALADRYRLDRELGRGGMATVYLAQDLKHRRPVALKVLHAELAHALGAERFLHEVETAAGLAHPHILPLFDSGEADGHQMRRKSLEFARQLFAQAIAIDPQFARAYAGLADAHLFLYEKHDPSEANLDQADAASRKALELDPGSAEAYAARGHTLALRNRLAEARQAFETAIRIAPRLFEAHYFFARACYIHGLREEAARHFEDAARVRPEDFQTRGLLANVLEGLGRREEAKPVRAQALQVIERHLELYPDDARALYFGALSLVDVGDTARAFEWLERALAVDPEDPSILYNVACGYATAGDIERALDCLTRAVERGMRYRAWIENDSDLDSLRNHPRYRALVAGL